MSNIALLIACFLLGVVMRRLGRLPDGTPSVLDERIATNAARSIVLGAICVAGAQQMQAQHALGDPLVTSAAGPELASPAAVPVRTQRRCAQADVDVAAVSSDQHRLVCSAARKAIERLGRCKIFLQRPLRIQILDEVRHPQRGEPIYGFFDTANEIILVTKYENIPGLVEDTRYRELQPLAFYESLVFHEVVHGAMHQNAKRKPPNSASHEYPAYALQIESLPANERRKLLQAVRGAESDEFIFSDVVLFFDPFYFAARAYQHFKAAPDGCAHLVALLEGGADFIQTSRLL